MMVIMVMVMVMVVIAVMPTIVVMASIVIVVVIGCVAQRRGKGSISTFQTEYSAENDSGKGFESLAARSCSGQGSGQTVKYMRVHSASFLSSRANHCYDRDCFIGKITMPRLK